MKGREKGERKNEREEKIVKKERARKKQNTESFASS